MTGPRPAAPTIGLQLAGERVRVKQHGWLAAGWIVSVHGIEHMVRTDATDGGMGDPVAVFPTSGRSAHLTPAPLGGDLR